MLIHNNNYRFFLLIFNWLKSPKYFWGDGLDIGVTKMRSTSTYFIVDFSYNPDSDKPLTVFELGDAFLSEYPNKKNWACSIDALSVFAK